MTETQAIAKATEKNGKWGRDYLVCHRESTGFYVIAKDEKRLWADDETLIFDTGRRVDPRREVRRRVEPRLEVTCESDGSVVIRADSYTAARLAGRAIFGKVSETQVALQEKLADAWYAADCP